MQPIPILIAHASDVRTHGEQIETVSDEIDSTVGGHVAAAVGGNVIPDVVKITIGEGSAAMRRNLPLSTASRTNAFWPG